MELRKKNAIVYINDNDSDALKVKAGNDYDIINGELVVYETQNEINNKYQIKNGIEKSKTLDELKNILIKYFNL